MSKQLYPYKYCICICNGHLHIKIAASLTMEFPEQCKTSGRKSSSCTHKPDTSGLNLPLVSISLKRNGDGCGTDLCSFDSESNALLTHFPGTRIPNRMCTFFSVLPVMSLSFLPVEDMREMDTKGAIKLT